MTVKRSAKIGDQWQRLLEIQEIQIDLMEKFVGKTPPENQS